MATSLFASFTITPAQFNALKTTPQTIVPSVSGKVIFPIRFMASMNVTTVYDSNWSLNDTSYFGTGYFRPSTSSFSLGREVLGQNYGGTSSGSALTIDPADVGRAYALTSGNTYTVGAIASPGLVGSLEYMLV
jgi:hypothetical protein